MKKRHVLLRLMIVLNEEKRIPRYCPFIEEQFWILYQVRHQDFSGGVGEMWGPKNHKKDFILSLMNEFNQK